MDVAQVEINCQVLFRQVPERQHEAGGGRAPRDDPLKVGRRSHLPARGQSLLLGIDSIRIGINYSVLNETKQFE